MNFLNLLDKLGRKRIVMDRGKSHPEYYLAKPWTIRYYPFLRKRPRWFPFNIIINHIIDDDHGVGTHNHPFPFITIIIRGGYWEMLEGSKDRIWRAPGYIGFRSADQKHRVDLEPDIKALTIFIAGPYGFRKAKRSGYN